VVDTGFVPDSGRSNACFEFQRTGHCSKPDCRYAHAPAGGGPARAAPPVEDVRLVRGADGALELAAAKPPVEKRDEKRKRHHKEKRSHREKESKHKRSKHKHSRRERSSESSDERAERAASESEASLLPPDAPAPPVLTADAYFEKNLEFVFWMRREGKGYFTDLSAVQARALFADFVKAWNERRLPSKVYAGEVTISGRR
jgi:hypothetical protein